MMIGYPHCPRDEVCFGHRALADVAKPTAGDNIACNVLAGGIQPVDPVMTKAILAVFCLLEVAASYAAVVAGLTDERIDFLARERPFDPSLFGVALVLQDDVVDKAAVVRQLGSQAH
jgi:hypothetical protein